ncbi:MAG: hypothetical protein AAGH99_01490 [Planctomycetota bacterium]
MKNHPQSTSIRSRWLTSLGCLALLALGTGCVSWDPIFRGSVQLAEWLRSLI